MSEVTSFPPGSFCWAELGTSDAEAASRFYSRLFGWEVNKAQMGAGAFYYTFRKGGKDVAAAYEYGTEDFPDVYPPNWITYFSVADLNDATRRVTELGGTVFRGPFDAGEYGRMAVVQEPSGAVFALWQSGNYPGAQLVGEDGAIIWTELSSRDMAASERFLVDLFGWQTESMNTGGTPYVVFNQGEKGVAGMMPILPDIGESQAYWLVYFGTDDCARTVARAKELGGMIVVEPQAIPDVGHFAVIEDPQKATFAVLQPEMMS